MLPRGRSQITKTFNLTQTENKKSWKGGRGAQIFKAAEDKNLSDPVSYIETHDYYVRNSDEKGN
jgi:hypothetical protein